MPLELAIAAIALAFVAGLVFGGLAYQWATDEASGSSDDAGVWAS